MWIFVLALLVVSIHQSFGTLSLFTVQLQHVCTREFEYEYVSFSLHYIMSLCVVLIRLIDYCLIPKKDAYNGVERSHY